MRISNLATRVVILSSAVALGMVFMISRTPRDQHATAQAPPAAVRAVTAELVPKTTVAQAARDSSDVRPSPAGDPGEDQDRDDTDTDVYEIRGFVHPPDETGLVRAVPGPPTGADMDYDAGLVDDDGNPTAVEIGSAEDEAMQLQAMHDEAADAAARPMPAARAAHAVGSLPKAFRCSDSAPIRWDALDDASRASFPKPIFDVISFDADARRRFVRVGSNRYEEGSMLPSGSRLIAIGPSTLTLEHRDCLIDLSYAEASR